MGEFVIQTLIVTENLGHIPARDHVLQFYTQMKGNH